jgi:tetratricopeptide (TPR) repeat protein
MTEGQNLNFAVPSVKLLSLEEYNIPMSLAAYAAASLQCRKILENSNDYFAWMNCGFAYMDCNLCEEAIKAFKKAITIKPENTPSNIAYNSIGIAYNRIGLYDEAIKAYKKAINLEPNEGSQYYHLGDIYEIIGRHDDAMEAYKQSIQAFNKEIKIKSDDSFKLACLYEGLGDVYGKLTRYDEAIEAYKQATQLQPFVLAHYN